MRILMLTQFYPPIIGGEERHVRNLSITLAARGHEVAVATLWQEGLAAYESDRGVRIYRVGALMGRMPGLYSERGRMHAPPFPDPETVWALRRVIVRERPEIVHAHNWMVYSFLPLHRDVTLRPFAKLVMTLHDCSLVCATKRFMYGDRVCSGPALGKCLGCATGHYGAVKGMVTTLGPGVCRAIERKNVDMFLPVSQAVAEASQLERYGLPYRVVPNFILDDGGLPCDDGDGCEGQLPEGDFLLFVGDLVRDKGVEVLLQAYGEMCRDVTSTGVINHAPTIPLVLIGRMPATIDRGAFCAKLPPNVLRSNVLYVGSWSHGAVMNAWRRCTIGLMPSLCLDACPTVAMEAMAMGKPIIASRIGGLADIVVDGETGLLVPAGDVGALQRAMRRLLDDAVERERMGEMARRRVVRFQARTVVPCIEQVYREVLR